MKKKHLLTGILLLMFSLLIVGCGNSDSDSSSDKSSNDAEKKVLKIGHTAQETEPYHIGLKAMDEKLQELTNGQLSLEIYPNSTLGDERQMIEAVQSGDLDMVLTANGTLANFSEDFLILDLPYLFRDWEHAWKVLDGEIGQEISESLKDKNLRVLAYVSAGLRHIMSKEPVNSIDDLKGLKLRVIQNPIHIDTFKAFGANPTPLAYSELYTGLQQGVVDAAEAANTNYLNQKFYEVADHWALVGWMRFISEIVINEQLYNSLTDEQKSALEEAALYAADVERKEYEQADEKAFDELKNLGVKVTEPDVTPFQEAAKKVWEQYADKVGGMDRIQKIQDTK